MLSRLGRRPRSAGRFQAPWTFGDVEVDDAPAVVAEHDEDEEDAQAGGGHGEEISFRLTTLARLYQGREGEEGVVRSASEGKSVVAVREGPPCRPRSPSPRTPRFWAPASAPPGARDRSPARRGSWRRPLVCHGPSPSLVGPGGAGVKYYWCWRDTGDGSLEHDYMTRPRAGAARRWWSTRTMPSGSRRGREIREHGQAVSRVPPVVFDGIRAIARSDRSALTGSRTGFAIARLPVGAALDLVLQAAVLAFAAGTV